MLLSLRVYKFRLRMADNLNINRIKINLHCNRYILLDHRDIILIALARDRVQELATPQTRSCLIKLRSSKTLMKMALLLMSLDLQEIRQQFEQVIMKVGLVEIEEA